MKAQNKRRELQGLGDGGSKEKKTTSEPFRGDEGLKKKCELQGRSQEMEAQNKRRKLQGRRSG